MLRKLFHVLLAGVCGAASAADPAAAPAATGTTPVAAAAGPEIIHIGGSDMLQTSVGEPLTRYAKQNHLNVKVDMLGSVPAMTGLKEGKIQLAIIAAPPGQSPAPPEYKVIKFCFQVDYVLVNQANPLNALNLRQIASVFGSVEQNMSYWGELQLAGEWTKRPIIAFSTSLDDGLVVELFKNLALGHSPLKSTVRIAKTSEEMIKGVADNPNGIGLGGFDPGPPSQVKVLLISTDQTSVTGSAALAASAHKDASMPTEENVYRGDYPLRLPFYLVYKPADKARLLPLLQLLLSPEYAANLRDQHYMPVPDTKRERSRLELDKSD